MHHPHWTRVPLAAAHLACLCSPAFAQQAQPPVPLDGVIVTGSNLKRIAAETDSPVDVIRREDIARIGASTVRELIESLPSASVGTLTDINGGNSFSPGASGASLRNLGKQSTLVLLNFRRVAPYALADYSQVFTNLDALPLDVIDRIEILKSGAAAVYGSDAVAGVINIITRSDYQGVQVRAAREQSITSGAFGSKTASITAGLGNLQADRYNLIGNIELYHRDALMWNQVLGRVNPGLASGAAAFGFGTPSTYSHPGNVQQADGSLAPISGCPAASTVNGLCQYDRYARFQALPESNRVALFTSGTLVLNNALSAFAEAHYSHGRTRYLSAYPSYGPDNPPIQWADAATLQSRTFTYRGLPAGNAVNASGADGANLRYRFVDAPSEQNVASDQYRVLGGLKGSWDAWEWESAIGYLGSRTRQDQRGDFSDSGFRQYVGDYDHVDANGAPLDPDFFNHGYNIGQANRAAVIDALFPHYGWKGRYDQGFVDGKAAKTLLTLPAGTVELAAGFELRRERFTITPSENLQRSDVVGLGLSSTDAARSFGALFTELKVPIVKTLETTAALRYDKYPNFNGHVSPKVGLRWEPARQLLFRGVAETGFRAPNLTESASSTKIAVQPGVSDPKRCPQASALAQALTNQANALPASDPNQSMLYARAEQVQANECAASLTSIVTNNPALKPEESRSFSLGMVFEPARGWSASIDYWNIHRRNEIGTPEINQLLSDESNLPAGNAITRAASTQSDRTFSAAELQQFGVGTGALVSAQQQFVNTSRTKTSGVDINLRAETAAREWGRLRFDSSATYLISYYAYSDVIGGYGDNRAGRYQYPRLNLNAMATWFYGGFETSLRANYLSATSLQGDFADVTYSPAGCADNFGFSAGQCRVGAYTTWDLYLAYSGVKNLTVGIGLKNIFAAQPPADLRALIESGGGIQPQDTRDAQGRMLKVALEYKF